MRVVRKGWMEGSEVPIGGGWGAGECGGSPGGAWGWSQVHVVLEVARETWWLGRSYTLARVGRRSCGGVSW